MKYITPLVLYNNNIHCTKSTILYIVIYRRYPIDGLLISVISLVILYRTLLYTVFNRSKSKQKTCTYNIIMINILSTTTIITVIRGEEGSNEPRRQNDIIYKYKS